MPYDYDVPLDALVRRSAGLAEAWLRKHGLNEAEVGISYGFAVGGPGRSLDMVQLTPEQFAAIPPGDYARVIEGPKRRWFMLYLEVPGDG